MTPQLEQFIHHLYSEVKADYPGVSEFQVKTAILKAVHKHAEAEADSMIAAVTMTEIVKALRALATQL